MSSSEREDSLSNGLAVGFLSLLNEPDEFSTSKNKESKDSLQSSNNNKYEPQLSFSSFIQKKGSTSGLWQQFWGECTLSGELILKRKEDSINIKKKYKLKTCSIVKTKYPTQFSLILQKKNTEIIFKAKTIQEADTWIATLSQYSYEMYTHLKLNETNVPCLIWNSRGIIITLNKCAVKLLGYNEEELLGKNINILLPSDKCSTNNFINNCILKNSDTYRRKSFQFSNTATIIPRKSDELYVLFRFGGYCEYNCDRYIFIFLPTSGSTDLITNAANKLDSSIAWQIWS